MKIPNKLRIDGEDWIVSKDSDLIRNENNYGEVDHLQRKISLDKNAPKIPVTLLHECIHVVSENGKLDLEEKQVARLAYGLYAIIRDNKLRFDE